MLNELARAFGMLQEPRVRGVLWLGIGLSLATLAALVLGVEALVSWASDTGYVWLDRAFEVLGVLGTVVVAWFLFPSIVVSVSSVFLERVVDATEDRYYPQLPPPRPVPLSLSLPSALRLFATALALNILALPLYVSLEKIDPRLIEASKDLYSSAFRAFRKVILPLSLPGVIAGSMLVFIPAVGDFINADYLGSPRTTMIGNVIQKQFLVVGVEGSKTGLYGTSFAAPVITGYSAILASKFTSATPTQVANQLLSTAHKDTVANYTAARYGQGEASLTRALAPVAIR